ncbi:deoxyribose-phosphate aldolase [Pseudoroseomonas globiformis]|uniref:Deoxyribose-phosphate aldolase n=1 Tax=Teichococcus globiformis TaxID=2307229 RepID=A0ABV7G822_9PROT
MALPVPSSPVDLARLIDHTLLKPEATAGDVLRHCSEAREHQFCSVCVNPVHVAIVAEALRGSGVGTCSVVGFPLGAVTMADKAAETVNAVANGADEIDMVINIGALREGRLDLVLEDIRSVRAAARSRVLKVIIEACLLDDNQKRTACRLAAEGRADFVKTSTGFSVGGATIADVALMRAAVGDALGVKASGGIRTREQAQAMIEAGATRIGASSGVALIAGMSVPASGY